ncbi:hypothetical protein [Diatraea saccharalis granulovirus]|uniref:Ac53 n=1 Tax=Diatraea saccharalis granulovirus TaxID=1675862 RepID=A0A0R7EYV6_9BBAC|nr:hypothetical protein [Diatraea saccharalis granulovirus]AKN80762.1 hypothetical protein [Diatraea saccharalis granulovirus]
MFFFITSQNECKSATETIIQNQFKIMECVICLNEINEKNKGVVYITFGGTADLERLMCKECDKRLEHNDPYKRNIEYRFDFPFVNNEQAKIFLEKSDRFVLNEGEEEKIEEFTRSLKNAADCYQDVEFPIKLNL